MVKRQHNVWCVCVCARAFVRARARVCACTRACVRVCVLRMSQDQNAGRSHSIKTDNSSIERVEDFKYLGTALTNQNSIQEEIKSRLKLGIACYYSVQNLLSSNLLSKKVKD